MELDWHNPNVRHVKKTLTETIIRSVTEIRHIDNTVTYAITEALSKSLLVEHIALNPTDETATKAVTNTTLNMRRSWLEAAPLFLETQV
jgi:hypothetical protein